MELVCIKNLRMVLSKLLVTLINFKKTAYHHYGKKSLSLFKFFYYSVIRINTFIVFENDLRRELPEHKLEPEFRVVKPSLEELARIREEMVLPREFYYDQIYHVTTCYLAFKGDELAYIHWVFFKGEYSRFLILSDGVAELNYNTALPKFRGKRLSAKMMAYISIDLKSAGYKKVMGVIHELNYPSIRCIESAGFNQVARIRAWGPINMKMKV